MNLFICYLIAYVISLYRLNFNFLMSSQIRKEYIENIRYCIKRHIEVYSEPCVTQVYSEPWHVQSQRPNHNPGIFITL